MNKKIIFCWLFFFLSSFSSYCSSSSGESPPAVVIVPVVELISAGEDGSDDGVPTVQAFPVVDSAELLSFLTVGPHFLAANQKSFSCKTCGTLVHSEKSVSQEEAHACVSNGNYCKDCFLSYLMREIQKGKAFVSCPSCRKHNYSEKYIRNLMRERGKILSKFERNLEKAPQCALCEKPLPEKQWYHWIGEHNCGKKGKRNYCCKPCMTAHVLAEIERGRVRVSCPFCRKEAGSYEQELVDETFCYPPEEVHFFLREVGTEEALKAKELFDERNLFRFLRGEGENWLPCQNENCGEFLLNPEEGDLCPKCKSPFVEPEIPKGCRRCPDCRALIFKTGGCSDMFCTECGFEGSWEKYLKNSKE